MEEYIDLCEKVIEKNKNHTVDMMGDRSMEFMKTGRL